MPTKAASSLRTLQVRAGPEALWPIQPNSRETSWVSLKSLLCTAGLLVFWFQVFLLFSESVFMRSKSTNKNKNRVLVGIFPNKSASVWGLRQQFAYFLFCKMRVTHHPYTGGECAVEKLKIDFCF